METVKWMDSLHPDSPVREYLRWMGQGGNDALFEAQYASLVAENADQPQHPFLTVVIRTQGARPEMLQDVLTCLQAQGDEDFEVVVIVHRGKQDALRAKKKFFLRSVKEEPHIESNYLHMCKDLHVLPAPAGWPAEGDTDPHPGESDSREPGK